MAGSAKKTVECFYDVISPYSWLGFEVICRYANRWNINLKLKPFFLGGVMQASGNQPPAFVANKGVYMSKDLVRLREYFDVPLNAPKDFANVMFKKGSLSAQRFITAVDMKHPELTEKVTREMWMRIWSRDEDITQPESFREAGKKAGLSNELIEDSLKRIKDQDVKDRLKAYTDEALKYGAFGAPTFVAHVNGEPEMVFGSDRFPILAQILKEEWLGPVPDRARARL